MRDAVGGNCCSVTVFSIESIPICDGGTPIDVTKVALDHSEVAIHQGDSSGVANTK